MKETIEQLLATAVTKLKEAGVLIAEDAVDIQVSRTKDEKHGDFASNLAMLLAKPNKKNPRELATALMNALATSPDIIKVEIASAGFINFYVNKSTSIAVIPKILNEKENFGRSSIGAKQKVLVEFVSANPTGPLHVGHGRGAAYGAALSDLLETAGFDVSREYYINDAGRQMNILAVSVWLRYLELHGLTLTFPANAYRGEYVRDIANELKSTQGDKLVKPVAEIFSQLPLDEPEGGDKDDYIDALVDRCNALLGAAQYRVLFDCGLNSIVEDIRNDLEEFGVHHQSWFSERSLVENGIVTDCLDRLKKINLAYEHEGALWFKSTAFGDEKDRVVQRENGHFTYFASDIAYHLNKFERGFERIVDIFGADHHGYMARIKASMKALLGREPLFDILLVQFAILYRGKEKVSMSTRSGDFVTLRDLRKEVGNDAARFFYIMRRSEQHMDFDLELAKSQSNENPVFYIQYAHARICSVLRQLIEQKKSHNISNGLQQLSLLTEPHEEKLLKTLARYPEMIESAARAEEPHQVTYYLRELANDFHSYYNAHLFIIDDENLKDARLSLIIAVQQVLRNALALIGVSCPENM